MSTTLRCWIAGSALAFSAFVLTAGSTPDSLGPEAGLLLLAIFLNAWVIAVCERAVAHDTGSLRVRRFPLGGRLLRAHPGVNTQLAFFILLFGFVSGWWGAAAWALLGLAVISLEVVRSMAWYIVPAVAAVHALLNMDEFQSLHDLLGTASGWVTGLALLVVQALIVAGPLLRADAGARLGAVGGLVALVASLPGYLGAFWLASRTPLRGQLPPLQALLFVMLVGGLLQSLVLGLMSWAADTKTRASADLSSGSPRGVGMALLPMLLPALAPLLPSLVHGSTAPSAWTGLGALLILIPAVPAAALVASALDRLDGRGSGWGGICTAAAALLLWLAMGPSLLVSMYEPGGTAAKLHAQFPVPAAAQPALAQTAGAAVAPAPSGLSPASSAAWGRTLTVLLFAAALLSVRWMRHARPLQRPASWFEFALVLLAGGGAAWWLYPRHGLTGATLGLAGGCLLALLIDLFHAEVRPPEPPEEPDDSEPEAFELNAVDVSPERGAPEIIT